MEKSKLNKLQVFISSVTAIILMIIFGISYRVLAWHLSAHNDIIAISPVILNELPMQIGDWTGKEIPLEEKIIQATETDAHISRRYSRQNNSEPVLLYVAFGVKARDLMPHRPEVCYTGAGWTIIDKNSLDLLKDDENILPSTIFQFKRGTFNTEKILVLDYYIVDGQYCRDVSLLRSRIWRGSGKVGYVAQVQIVTTISANTSAVSAEETVNKFAVESAPYLSSLLEKIKEENTSKEFDDIYRKNESD